MECEEETVRKWKKDLEQVGIVDFPGKESNGKERERERRWREKNLIGFMQCKICFCFSYNKKNA